MFRQKRIILFLLIFILIMLVVYFLIKFLPIYMFVLTVVGKLLLPFLLAGFISYLLHPIVDFLVRKNFNRTVAVSIIFLSFICFLFITCYFAFPKLTKQLADLNEQLPNLFHSYEQFIYFLYESTAFLPELVHDKMTEFIHHVEISLDKKISYWIDNFSNIFDFIVILTIIPVLVFYFLKDFEKIKHYMQVILKKHHYIKAELVMTAIDDSLGKYIRGQVMISLAITFITLISYHFLNIKYALVLALFAGLMNVIPYFGPIIGLAPALLLSLTMSWKTVMIVILTTVIVQLLEGSFLSPYIMGKSVQIHPIVIILSLLVGVEIAGIIGMVLIVPLITIGKGIYEKLREG